MALSDIYSVALNDTNCSFPLFSLAFLLPELTCKAIFVALHCDFSGLSTKEAFNTKLLCMQPEKRNDTHEEKSR